MTTTTGVTVPSNDTASTQDHVDAQIRDDAALSMLVHGLSKTGKSTFTSTAPVPILVLDAEGSWRFITERGFQSGLPLRSRVWDPLEPPPRHDGTWDVCRVIVQDWPTILRVYEWLRSSPHDFVSVVVDSVSELQRRCKKNIRTDGMLQQQDWGALLDQMGEILRGLRDLTENLRNPLRVAVFVAETRQDAGRYKPYVQGQLDTLIPYMFDVIGYLAVYPVADAHGGTTQYARRLIVGPPREDVVVGERVQGRLGYTVQDLNIVNMVNTVFPPTPVSGTRSLADTTPTQARS